MKQRLKIIGYWIMLNSLLFWFFGLFLWPIIAANIAMIITVAAFTHDANKPDRDKLQRPTLYIRERNW